MSPDPTYKYFGLLSAIVLVLGLSFVLIKWPRGKQYTFSQHIAQHKTAIVYYIFLFTVSLSLLDLFFLEWFIPTFQLSGWFSAWIILASIFQLLCTLIPELPGVKTTIHKWLAGISGICLVPPVFLLVTSAQFQTMDRIVAGASLIIMLTLMAFMTINKAQHANFLIIQASYYVAFFLPFMLAAY